MCKLKYTFNRQALSQIYISYVLPILEYSSIVWDGCTSHESQTLENLRNEAARIVTGLTRSVSLFNLYREYGWVPLMERKKEQKLVFMYKSINGIVPSYITDHIPPLVRETTNYPLRNNNNVTVPFTRTEISHRSCIPSSISLWNSLNLRETSSVATFKYQLKNLRTNSKVPSYFINGDRYLSKLYARIRNNCSYLKNDLYINHLSPSPNCGCANVRDDAEHFFFRCPYFEVKRMAMFHSINTFHLLNLQKILFGDDTLSDNDNLVLFNAIQNFIKDSGRLTTIN